MLKNIGRILVILLVSGLIAGGIYLIVQQNPSALGYRDRPAGYEGNLDRNFAPVSNGSAPAPASTGSHSQPTRFREDDHGFEAGVSIGRGLFGITRNLIVFSLITFLVVTIQKIFSRINRKQPVRGG